MLKLISVKELKIPAMPGARERTLAMTAKLQESFNQLSRTCKRLGVKPPIAQ